MVYSGQEGDGLVEVGHNLVVDSVPVLTHDAFLLAQIHGLIGVGHIAKLADEVGVDEGAEEVGLTEHIVALRLCEALHLVDVGKHEVGPADILIFDCPVVVGGVPHAVGLLAHSPFDTVDGIVGIDVAAGLAHRAGEVDVENRNALLRILGGLPHDGIRLLVKRRGVEVDT